MHSFAENYIYRHGRNFPAWLADGEVGVWRYVAVALLVLAAAGIAEGLLLVLQMTRISLVLLASVVLAATWLGARPATFAAFLAIIVYDALLLQPAMQARLDSTEQIVTLTIFLLVALLTGGLAGRVRDVGKRSAALAANNTMLFQASRQMSVTDQEAELRSLLVQHVRNLTNAPAALAVADETPPHGTDTRLCSLQAHGEQFGSLYWKNGNATGPSRDLDSTIQVLADLCASSIARARLATQKARLESVAETERLQAALLSSISHDFRTPLSAILTAASSLHEFGEKFNAETRADLYVTIQEEAERLNQFVINLLQITKLDAGVLRPESASFDPAEIIARVTRRLNVGAPAAHLEVQADLFIRGDPILFEQALVNVIENALRFSGGAPISIGAARDSAGVSVTIADRGAGVPEQELETIFERFYRASNNATATHGCGLGLSITRGLIEAMGGAVKASPGDDGVGLKICMTLPAANA
ncbi:MAG: ATP-binding protein [Hyphomonadaceae bacterium]